ncbi:MAG: ABC transporter permease [Selenomonadaceae bacterium]|nr:ABC transporter permease [Selenomonadaceae bacterium]MBR6888193.1 ABC transporter permease [Selenomonadaceae bacterium]
MRLKFFLRMIFYSLLRRRMRMLIALIAVAVGATIISGMVTVYREVPQQLGREFRAYGANLLIIPANEAATFNLEKISEVREVLSGNEIIGAAPFLYERLEINKQYILTGGTDFAELQKVSPYWQIEGAYPNAGEREVLIGAQLAKVFSPYEPSEIIGQEVTISAGEGRAMKKYIVSGIVSTGGKEEDFAFMNLDNLQEIVEKPAQISVAQFSVVAEGDSLNLIEEKISSSVEGIQPQLVQQIANSEFNVLSKLQVLVLLVSVVVLILTLICVTTTMMAVVTERRKEIGLKKALGAANQNIVREFLGEGCLLGAFGGLFGSGLGYLFAESVSVQVFGRGIYFSVSIALLSIVLSIIVTGVASLISVRIATAVDPAIVLRGE